MTESQSPASTTAYFKKSAELSEFLKQAEFVDGESAGPDHREYLHRRASTFAPQERGAPHAIFQSGLHQPMFPLAGLSTLHDQFNEEQTKKLLPWDLRATVHENLAMIQARGILSQRDKTKPNGHVTVAQLMAEALVFSMPSSAEKYLFAETGEMYLHSKAVMATFRREHPGMPRYATWKHWFSKLGEVWRHDGKEPLDPELVPYTITEQRVMQSIRVLHDDDDKQTSFVKTRAQIDKTIDSDQDEDKELLSYVQYLGETLSVVSRLTRAYLVKERANEPADVLNALTTLHLYQFQERNDFLGITKAAAQEAREAAQQIINANFSEDEEFEEVVVDGKKIAEKGNIRETIASMKLPPANYEYCFQEYTSIMYFGTLPLDFENWKHALQEVFAHTGFIFFPTVRNATHFLVSDLGVALNKATGLAKYIRVQFLKDMMTQNRKKAEASTEELVDQVKSLEVKDQGEAEPKRGLSRQDSEYG